MFVYRWLVIQCMTDDWQVDDKHLNSVISLFNNTTLDVVMCSFVLFEKQDIWGFFCLRPLNNSIQKCQLLTKLCNFLVSSGLFLNSLKCAQTTSSEKWLFVLANQMPNCDRGFNAKKCDLKVVITNAMKSIINFSKLIFKLHWVSRHLFISSNFLLWMSPCEMKNS